jgi:hypothetical protein
MLVVKIMHQIPWKKMRLTFFVEGSTYLGGQTDKDVCDLSGFQGKAKLL